MSSSSKTQKTETAKSFSGWTFECPRLSFCSIAMKPDLLLLIITPEQNKKNLHYVLVLCIRVQSSPCKPFHLVNDVTHHSAIQRQSQNTSRETSFCFFWNPTWTTGAGDLPDGMKAACCWNCMLARACWYGNTPALNIVGAPLAFSSAGLFGKGGKTGGSPWWGGVGRVVVVGGDVWWITEGDKRWSHDI